MEGRKDMGRERERKAREGKCFQFLEERKKEDMREKVQLLKS